MAILVGQSSVAAEDLNLAVKVNGEGITRNRVQAALDGHINRAGMNYGGIMQPDRYRQIQDRVLDELIAQELLWQEARRKNHVAPDSEVDATVERLRGQFDSQLAFDSKLRESGFTAETFREDIKKRISVRNMITQEIMPTVQVGDDEINRFYDANLAQMEQPEQIRARHILIKLSPKADTAVEEAARRRIEKIRAEALAGADFAELARKYSEDSSAQQGGDLGFFGRGRMVGQFENVAFALQPRELSEVVRTRYGYHIIRLEERRETRTLSRDEVSGRIRKHLASQKVQHRLAEITEQLRAAATVEVLLYN